MICATSLLLILIAPTLFATPLQKASDDNFKLIILHNNDMHARFEQTNAASGRCKDDDAVNNRCYGGFARVAHEVRKYKQKAEDGEIPPVLYLNAGDTYTGTPWFSIFKDNITAAFLNILKPDAMSLGNHEFDEGPENLGKFLDEIDIPVLAANLILDNEPSLQGKPILKPSDIFTMNDGTKIGIIGYLTPETKGLAIPNDVEFIDEIIAINEEASRLKSQGIDIIIALGHSGIERDKQIAHDCPDIDLVIGGHSHTFLYTGPAPDSEVPEDLYPVEITQPNGRVVPVVQSYAYTKYLGYISLEFDSNGELAHIDGTPILLNATIERENDVLELLELYRPAILELQNEIIGSTRVNLDGSCRRVECNLGNFIADSMVDWNALKHGGEGWTDAAIAFIQGGGIRTSIMKEGNGTITKEDIQTVMPFESKVYVIEVTGEVLMQALEHSVHRYNDGEGYGEFLQYSGVQVEYDMNNEAGKRVVNAKVICAYCTVPTFESIDFNKKYRIITQDFLEGGGDGFEMLKGTKVKESEDLDIDVLSNYMKKKSPIYPAIEWRITINPLKNPKEEIVGSTKVYLDGNCHRGECNLGNFIADSIVDLYALKYQQITGWTDASIAFIQASNIRHSIDNTLNDGQITLEDAQNILPNGNKIVLVDVRGDVLKPALEHAVARYSDEVHLSEFLQMSGMQVEIDINKPVNSRVVSIKVLCSLCTLPEWETFNETENYKVLMPENMANGAEGFTMFSEFIEESLEFTELDSFLNYLKKKSPIYPAREWRITIKQYVDPSEDVVGKTRVFLDNDCQNSECNLGNFITDAMVDWYAEKYNNSNYWTDASIAMFQGSHIGTSIDPNTNNGSIFRADVVKIFQPTPYDLHTVILSGKQIHDVLEYSMAKYEENKNDEDFLQLSGIQVIYDLNKPSGSRIADLKILCAECSKPQLEMLVSSKNYKVIMQSIMLTEDYRDVISSSFDVNLNETDINVFLHYVKKKSPIYPAIEERIKIVPKSETTTTPSSATKTKFSTALILIALITYFH